MLARWRNLAASSRSFSKSKTPRICYHRRSLSTLTTELLDTVKVPCASNGEITLNILNGHASADKPLIIYLPGHQHFSQTTSLIPEPFHYWPVVRINYRWSAQYRFPTPIHDTLFGYDWILDNLVHSQDLPTPAQNILPKRRIFIYGSDLGGSLATSLALTECRPRTSPVDLVAAAVEDGVFDWPSMVLPLLQEETLEDEPGALEHSDISQVTGADVLKLAKELFTSPSQCFDSFASPLYFFRTAGQRVPAKWDGSMADDDPYLLGMLSSPSTSSTVTDSTQSRQHQAGLIDETQLVEEQVNPRVPRKALLKFPPRHSGIRIPTMRISVSREAGLLQEQAEEMVRLLRRSVVKYDNEGDEEFQAPRRHQKARITIDPDYLDFMSHEAEHRIQLETKGEQGETEAVAEWFNELV